MSTISTDALVGQLVGALDEALNGPAKPDVMFFSDRVGGILPSVEGLSAAEASRLVGADSVAGQVGHVAFCLRAFAYYIRRESPQVDWAQSWATNTVDAAGWEKLKAELRAAVADVRGAVTKHAAEAPDSAMFAVGAVAHTVYHLGALRKMLAMLRQK
jgi:hypothetical protein